MSHIKETNVNKYGSKMTITEYRKYNDITVEFENGYKTYSRYSHFQNGSIVSPYCKMFYNIGYIGEGKYKIIDENSIQTIQYIYWHSMLERCYSKKYLMKQPTYEDKYVCKEWHCYQTFAKWFDGNYYPINNEKMCLDKDILNKNNKIYSPETCILVPQRINNLFTKRQNCRGDYPIGVSYHNGKFRANCSIFNRETNKKKQIYLGRFKTPQEAFYEGYKPFKENYIKEVANDYKAQIPKELYDAMMNYIVEIDD